jgi:hypothetical protein
MLNTFKGLIIPFSPNNPTKDSQNSLPNFTICSLTMLPLQASALINNCLWHHPLKPQTKTRLVTRAILPPNS